MSRPLPPIPAHARRKIERLTTENELLRDEIRNHMRIYGDTLGELVTLKVQQEQAIRILQGADE